MWLAIEFEDFPGWFDWQKGCFELIQANLLPIGAPGAAGPSRERAAADVRAGEAARHVPRC